MTASGRPSLLKRMFGEGERRQSSQTPVQPVVDLRPGAASSPFGEYGEKGERVGEQIAYFISRLDELYGLRQEFASVAEPMQDFIKSHAEAQTRLAEASALLARERSDAQTVRSEALNLRTQHSRSENALAEAQKQIQLHEDVAETRNAQLKSLQIAHDDVQSRLAWTARQLAAEEQANADHGEIRRRLDEEFGRVEQELAQERARFLDLKDQHEASAVESRRLQSLLDKLQPALTSARRRVADLENDLGTATATQGMLELKIASEQELRRATELARSQEKIAFDNEMTTLAQQAEALESRNATTMRIFEQSRALVNEKIEQVRQLERAAKDVQAERIAHERRHAQGQDEIRRLTDQVAALGTRHQDAQERSGMLTNALAAKDAQIEQLEGRCDALKNQLEDAVQRYEQERVAVEAQNRTLIEEVQSERAERALAQGALSIARNSREKLLCQIEDLKRQRASRVLDHDGDVDQPIAAAQTNIHKFRGNEPVEGA